jgi:hypothetical protein
MKQVRYRVRGMTPGWMHAKGDRDHEFGPDIAVFGVSGESHPASVDPATRRREAARRRPRATRHAIAEHGLVEHVPHRPPASRLVAGVRDLARFVDRGERQPSARIIEQLFT